MAWQCPLIVPLGQVPFVDGQITYCKKKTWFARKSSITAGFSYFSWIGKSPCQYGKSFQNRISEAGALQKFVPAGPWLALAASWWPRLDLALERMARVAGHVFPTRHTWHLKKRAARDYRHIMLYRYVFMCIPTIIHTYITLDYTTLQYTTLQYNTTQHNAIHTVIVHLDTSDSLTIQRDGEKQFGTIPAIAIQLPPNIDASHLPSLLLWPASGLTG